jgi:hypothetical protein
LTYLKPVVANWRYQRGMYVAGVRCSSSSDPISPSCPRLNRGFSCAGHRSLLENLSGAGVKTGTAGAAAGTASNEKAFGSLGNTQTLARASATTAVDAKHAAKGNDKKGSAKEEENTEVVQEVADVVDQLREGLGDKVGTRLRSLVALRFASLHVAVRR